MRDIVFDKHNRDFNCDFTIEFNVKMLGADANLPEEIWQNESENGTFASMYCQKCYDEIQKSKYDWITDWGLAGRSGGWFVLVCSGEKEKIRTSTLERISNIVNKYIDNYSREIRNFYHNIPFNSAEDDIEYNKTIKDLEMMYNCLDNITLPVNFDSFDNEKYTEHVTNLQSKLRSHLGELLEAEKKDKEYRMYLLTN